MKKLAAMCVLLLLSVLLFVLPIATRRSQAAIAGADLSVSKVDNPDPVNTGSNLTYTITVTNNGPDAATNASWADTLPAGTTFVALSEVGGWSCISPDSGDSGTVSCSNPSSAVGSSVFSLTVAVGPTVLAGSILSNTATATSSTADATPGNNSGTASTTVLSPALVTGNKSRSGGGTPGSTLSYLIILSNSSNSDQQDNPGNEFTDVLPTDLTLVAANSSEGTAIANTGTNTVTWNGVVPAQDSVTITIEATIKPGTEEHTITNQGTISYDADGNGTNEASATTNVDSFGVGATALNADLGVTKTAPDTVPSDSDVTYVITVTNGGPDTATSATLSDTLQGNMTFVSLSQPAGWSCSSPAPGSGGTITCSRDLPAGSGAQVFTLVGHIPSGTANGTFYNNMAVVSTTSTDSNSENDVATAGTTVMCATDSVVTTNADSGAGSLRKAILDACDGGTITFDMTPGHVVSPITLTSAELVISKSLTIQGPGANLLTVQRSAAGGTPNFRIFNVTSGTVNIDGLTIANGNVGGGGGGIMNRGILTLNATAVSGNTSSNSGGGIQNDGGNASASLTLINSTVSGNTTSSFGAGILSTGYQGSATLNIINSTISGNTGPSFGGGVYNDGNSGTATLTSTNSTISGNAGSTGGGIFNFGNGGTATLTLRNTILSDNQALNASSGPDIYNSIGTVSGSNNIIQTSTGYTISGSNNLNVDPKLQKDGTGALVLKNNGGSTQTLLLLPSSPAINAGSNANLPADTFDLDGDGDTAEPLPVDQRGFARIVNTTVDIGAVEVNYAVSATAGTPQSTNVNTAFATALQATVTESGNPQNGISVTFTAPGSSASGTFTGASTTAVVSTNSSGVATVPTFTANSIGGTYNVVASIGTGLPTATFVLTNNKLNQTITFGPLAARTFGDADFSVSASASSGLAVSFSASGNCTVTSPSPGTVHITGAGSCTIAASQSGNATYSAATDVQQTFIIAKAATATVVSSSVNPSNSGQSVTFTATVTSTAGTPTGTVQFKDGGANLGAPQALNGSGVATFSTSSLVAGVHVITADYSGDSNFLTSTGTLSGGQQAGSIIRFSSSTYNTTEGSGFTTITVQRIGDLSQAASVDYATPDDSSAMTVLPCSTANGVASSRCDFETALGTLRFAVGDGAAKTFTVLINQDNFVEGPETLTLTLSNLTGGAGFTTPGATTLTATLTITDDVTEPETNPIDDTDTFVRQHYRDFLNREPDASGLAFWKDNIDKCNDPARRPAGLTVAQCIEVFRINTSAAFFISIEFQDTGYFVERIYKSGFGDISPPTVPVPVRFTNFLRDTQEIGAGVIVGQGNWQPQLDNNKSAFALAFAQRAAFVSRYPGGTSATDFVDSLNANAGGVLSDSERSALIAELSPNPADPALRASVLKKVADNATLKQREFNRAFVLMEYFGYLRRNPDAAPDLNFNGYNFWLNKLNQFNGNFVNADMVKAFLLSGEYRQRFGP
jgi:uncharacterized repeat protein (TIGR01451 family)